MKPMLPTVKDCSKPLQRFCSALLGLALCALLLAPPVLALSDTEQLVVESWRLVNQSYLDPTRFEQVHWRRLRQNALATNISSSEDAYAAIEGMLLPLGDPYTRLLRPLDYQALQASNSGSISGVGLQLDSRGTEGQILVIAPLEGSPAADAGVVSGTRLISVNGQSAEELGLQTAAARLRGEVGSQVVVELQAPEGEIEEVSLERRNVDLRPVRTRRLRSAAHTLGYLRITQFSEGVPEQVQEALKDLSDKDVEGLVLDLRNNSGGLVSSGLAVADAFLSDDPIVETRNREGIDDGIRAGRGMLYEGPMVTLVNGGTASASEILAGALRDNGRSQLLGSQTFGKGMIQTLTNLSDGSGLAVTVAAYVTPSGQDIQNRGIEPDRILDQPEPLNPGGDGDRWLTDAERWMEAQLEVQQQEAQLQEAQLQEAQLQEAQLQEAQLQEAPMQTVAMQTVAMQAVQVEPTDTP
ncbi:MAG: carboxyl-terminal processing protease CtpZ [Prochlorococcus sp.]